MHSFLESMHDVNSLALDPASSRGAGVVDHCHLAFSPRSLLEDIVNGIMSSQRSIRDRDIIKCERLWWDSLKI